MTGDTAQPQGSPFLNLMADLAKDQKTRDDFQKDPTTVMQSYGLPQGQIDLVLQNLESDKPEHILSVFADEVWWPCPIFTITNYFRSG